MSTIVLRSVKGSALSFTEMDNNFSNINTDKLEAIVTDTTPQLGGNLDVNGNSIVSVSNGNIAITPDGTGKVILDGLSWPTSDGTANYVLKTDGAGNLGWVAQSGGLSNVVEDTTPQLGGNLDVNGNSIVSTSAGNITITPDTTGAIVLDGVAWPTSAGTNGYFLTTNGSNAASWTAITQATGSELENIVEDTSPQLGGNLDVQTYGITTSTSNGDITVTGNGTGIINLNGTVEIADLQAYAEKIEVLASVSGTLSIDATAGPIKYVVPAGNCTINGFSSPVAGQTVTFLFDQATYSTSFTLTLGAGILTPGGAGVTLTATGNDLVTITCVDSVTPVYVATSVANFQ